MSSIYQAAFFIVPSRIMNLPGLTMSFLKIYETIFQFWNHGKNCYLSNAVIMERTGISSESTLRDAFMYFEKHGELIRKNIANKRYFVQPERSVEIETAVDNSSSNSSISVQGVDSARGGRRQSDGGGVDAATHNKKKINSKNREREQRPLSNFESYPQEYGADKKERESIHSPLPEKQSCGLSEEDKKNKGERAVENQTPGKLNSLYNFVPSQENINLSNFLAVDLNEEIISFKNRHNGKGDLQYEFERWLKNAKEYQDRRKLRQSSQQLIIKAPSPQFWEPGNSNYDNYHGASNNNY